jgi:membrane protein implicated in regulation of membrane protease activity
MIDYIQAHQSGFWIATGFALLAMEVLLFGFTTIVLLFAGLGAIITGLLMLAGVLDQTWITGVASFGICTGISSVLLWKPLRSMQDKSTPVHKQSSDFIGYEFVLQQSISLTQTGLHRYSGVDWKVEIDASAGVNAINAGQRVKVCSLDAGVLRVAVV